MNESAVEALTKPQSRRAFLAAGALGGATALLAGCGVAATASPTQSKGNASLYLTIATPAMLGTDDMPAYLPAFPTIPAHTRVRVEIVNFDDATPLTGALEQFAKVKGTVGGSIHVEALDEKNPNATTTSQTVTALDPQNVSHTFTVAKLGINIPVAAKARTIFEIQTGAPGVYDWRCNDPCGQGNGGWGGAMAVAGYMMGKLTLE
jgi:hypothetical protein